MKTTWVLSEREKVERMAKQSENRAKRQAVYDNFLMPPTIWPPPPVSPSAASTTSSRSTSSPPVKEPPPLTPLEEKQIDSFLAASHEANVAVSASEAFLDELDKLTKAPTAEPMADHFVVELFKTSYSRSARFAGAIPEFAALPAIDRRCLLSRNLDALANARLASACMDPAGRACPVGQAAAAGVGSLGDRAVEPEQVYRSPWSVDSEHAALYCRTARRVARRTSADPRAAVLFQLVVLFDTTGVDGLEERSAAEAAQETFVNLLWRHLVESLGRSKATVACSSLVLLSQDLRRLADRLTGEGEGDRCL